MRIVWKMREKGKEENNNGIFVVAEEQAESGEE